MNAFLAAAALILLLTLGAGGAAFRLAGRGVALEGLRLPLDL